MKNIQILPTSQPSNLLLCIKSYIEHKDTPAENSDNKGNFRLGFGIYANTEFYQHHHIYITNSEEIKDGDWFIDDKYKQPMKYFGEGSLLKSSKKIILTTDVDLIKEGVQTIDDEFLEWFVENQSCESVLVTNLYGDFNPIEYFYEIIIPKQEQKQHIIDMMKSDEETAEEYFLSCIKNVIQYNNDAQAIRFMEKYYHDKKEQERSYSEEEVFNLLMELSSRDINSSSRTPHSVDNWFEQFKKK